MKFEPKTREELSNLLPEGNYQGTIDNAEEKESSGGNSMIVLRVGVYDNEGNKRIITDRLILIESMQWKLFDFCESADLMDRYESGELSANDCIERTVHCKVVRKKAEGEYPEKNEIKTYYLPKGGNPKPAPVKAAAPKNSRTTAPVGAGKPKDDGDVPF